MTCFLSTYMPLAATKYGRIASTERTIPPFVDGSIRREPDLEHTYPSISCLCHADKFAPRLRVGDNIGFMTQKRKYGLSGEAHRRLTAVLNVVDIQESHESAAAWYCQRNLPLPNNCLVMDNPPKLLEESHSHHKARNRLDDNRLRQVWEREYQKRAKNFGTFVICQSLFSRLSWEAPIIEDEYLIEAFGRIPGTQNPPAVPCNEFQHLMEIIGVCLMPRKRIVGKS